MLSIMGKCILLLLYLILQTEKCGIVIGELLSEIGIIQR